MSRLADLLRLPLWLRRTWKDTVIVLDEAPPDLPDPHQAETVPLPLYGALAPRQ